MNAKLVHIHPSDQEIGKICAPLPLQASPNNCVSALRVICRRAKLEKWLRDAKEKYELSFAVAPQPGNLDMGEVLAYLGMLSLRMQSSPMEPVILRYGQINF